MSLNKELKNIEEIINKMEYLYKSYDLIQFSLYFKVAQDYLCYLFHKENLKIFDEKKYRELERKRIKELLNFYRNEKLYKNKKSEEFSRKFFNINLSEIVDLANDYAHYKFSIEEDKISQYLSSKTIDCVVESLNIWIKKIFKKNINLNILSSNQSSIVIDDNSYEITIDKINKRKLIFETTKIQRIISWESGRIRDFLNDIQKKEKSIFQISAYEYSSNQINVFDGQHRLIILFYLFYLKTGNKITYKIGGEEIDYSILEQDKKFGTLDILLKETWSWFIQNQNFIDFEKFTFRFIFYDVKEYKKIFLFKNSIIEFKEIFPGLNNILIKISNFYELNEKEIEYLYSFFLDYIFSIKKEFSFDFNFKENLYEFEKHFFLYRKNNYKKTIFILSIILWMNFLNSYHGLNFFKFSKIINKIISEMSDLNFKNNKIIDFNFFLLKLSFKKDVLFHYDNYYGSTKEINKLKLVNKLLNNFLNNINFDIIKELIISKNNFFQKDEFLKEYSIFEFDYIKNRVFTFEKSLDKKTQKYLSLDFFWLNEIPYLRRQVDWFLSETPIIFESPEKDKYILIPIYSIKIDDFNSMFSNQNIKAKKTQNLSYIKKHLEKINFFEILINENTKELLINIETFDDLFILIKKKEILVFEEIKRYAK